MPDAIFSSARLARANDPLDLVWSDLDTDTDPADEDGARSSEEQVPLTVWSPRREFCSSVEA
ncbi:hypothetical protein [Arthrobacter sp. HLT1-21]